MEDDRMVLLPTEEEPRPEGGARADPRPGQGGEDDDGRQDGGAYAPPSPSGAPPWPPSSAAAPPPGREPAPIVYLASCVAAVGGVLFGYDVGVISEAKTQMKEELGLSCAEVSAIVAMLPVGGFVASLVGGLAVDKYGRKVTIMVNALFFMVGALLIAATSSLTLILFGRFVLGFAVSLSAIAECIYISEISTPDRRGALVSLNELGITVGVLVAYIVNYIFADCAGGWRYSFALSAAVAAAHGAAMLCLPRTPQFLVISKKDREAEETLRRLNLSGDVRQTMADIRHSLADQQAGGGRLCSFFFLLASNADNLGSRLLIGCGLVLFQQFSGQPNILYYAADVFRQVGFCSEFSSALATVGLGMLKVGSTAVSLSLVDRIGRRKALVAGVSVMAVSVAGMAAVAFNQDSIAMNETCVDVDVDSASNTSSVLSRNVTLEEDLCSQAQGASSSDGRVFAFISLVTFVCAYSFSFGPITWVVLSEIFPAATKGRAMALATSLNWLGNAVVSATFLDATAAFSLGGVFLSYSMVCAVAVSFVVFLVPETKNKSLEEISKELKAKSTRGMVRDNLSRTRCCRRVAGNRGGRSESAGSHHYSVLHTEA